MPQLRAELEQFGPPGSQDQPNEAFWKKFEAALKEAAELVMELGKEQGIDLSQIEVSAKELAPPPPATRHEPLLTIAKAGERMADEWFENHTRAVQAKGDELMRQFQLGVAEPEREAALIFDAVEVIRWYQPFIRVKLARAIEQETRSAGAARDLQNDVNGSVKAALIAMDRSLAAWIELGRCFPEDRDDTLPVLARLDRLRRETEKAFPLARQFARPGFDDPASVPDLTTP